jgi:L-fucose mutarotase/ribose pyranase (RbsD/FucU family)
MRMISRLSAVGFGAIVSLMTAAAVPAEENPNWRPKLSQQLPLLGHRNWIVIADSAYPKQTGEGIETIATGAEQLTVLKAVLAQIKQSKHVRPIVYLDAELPFVSEDDAPGIAAYRNELKSIFKDAEGASRPHEEIIDKLDSSAQKFHVLILKTNMKLPYTSVFIQLDCGYWSAEAEARLRDAMKQAAPTESARASEKE